MKDISNNIKKIMMVFLICFLGLFMYITYFEISVGPKIVSSQYNRRIWAQKNKVLRGSIYDRNNKEISKSSRIDEKSQKRQYIGGEAFAHVLGYINPQYGITGIERRYDEQLSNTDIKEDIKSIFKIEKDENKEKYGNNLKTSLDFNLQQKAYELLGDKKGAVVALNPKTGEVLALVSKPSYNPNNLKEIWGDINKNENRPLLNRATSGLYPPGSIFKVVTAASALQNIDGLMSKVFIDNGALVFNERQSLKNYGGAAFGSINFRTAFIRSSNVVFGQLGLDLGNSKLKKTSEDFYFNKDINSSDIAIENSQFPTLKSNEKGNIAQSAIGQASLLATPMEMALVSSTIANDGVMMKPYIVKEIVNKKGIAIDKKKPEALGEIVSKDVANIIKDLMASVVSEGTGGNAAVQGIRVCGKTGTADHKEGGYGYSPHSWFMGFAPYENPQVAVAVIVEEGGQGGGISSRIASQIIRTALYK
ncbi:beta-lactamase [Clostridium tetani]|uniref:Beta-lactamase n=1 Tax=Clostridium tetani TaxID=1513 RepID=A0A4Q0VD80_CLOTA|nr:penicillin-binding protein 2 [Clostridium tetani]RXI48227.1 penicillin-binding protein 2 [Clostridium tetani]BDR68240.1 beta-lactamase [Clostridium tetani]BDR73799.1 beta-lactamase [Clostridium tetani]BDR82171.1 beta-lactamase [Clostridium tetani]BDR90560.1 beta-lactamase [Clostridium tetani]